MSRLRIRPRLLLAGAVALAATNIPAIGISPADDDSESFCEECLPAPKQVLDTTTRYCAGAGLAVPESGFPVFLTYTVPASGNVTDIDVELATTHAHTGDLTVVRLSRGNTVVILLDHPMGNPPNDIGCQGSNPNLVFDDEGTNGVAQDQCRQGGSAYVPVGGHFRPRQPLSAFDNTAAAGTYTISFSDPYEGDPGSIQNVCLVLTTTGNPDLIFANDFDG